MPSGVTSGWTLALMKIVLMVFDFALWVSSKLSTYQLKMFAERYVSIPYLLSQSTIQNFCLINYVIPF